MFGDERLTAALPDRLTHKAPILEFACTESCRFRERMQWKMQPECDDRAVDMWATRSAAESCPLTHSFHYDGGVVRFSVDKYNQGWFTELPGWKRDPPTRRQVASNHIGLLSKTA